MNPNATLIAETATKVGVISPDGEHLFNIPVAAGVHRAGDLLRLLPEGCRFDDDAPILIIDPPSGVGIQPYGKGSHDCGANPDFQPTNATRLEKQMRVTIAQMQATTKRLDARERALAQIERIPNAPAPAPETKQEAETPVVE